MNGANIKSMCRACLRADEYVCTMSETEINLFNELIGESTKEVHWQLCVYCRFLLRKFALFINQCREAEDNFEILLQQNSTNPTFLSKLSTIHNFVKTNCKLTYLGPKYLEIDDTTKLNYDHVKEETIDHLSDNDFKFEYDVHDYECVDDDDIPLVLLKNDVVDEIIEDDDVKDKSSKKKKKKLKNDNNKDTPKKVLPEGFSSRMVQETEEYVVIKLNREQVLEEMSAKRSEPQYSASRYRCDSCALAFNFQDVLDKHMQRHEPRNGWFRCDICNQYCPSKVSLRGHIKSHTTRYKCKVCGSTRRNRQHLIEHHALVHARAPLLYTCRQCDYTTDKRTVMQRHARRHASRAAHECHCGAALATLDALRVHTARVHSTKLLQCEQCTKTFIYPSMLSKHVRSVHINKDYYCVECDVKFSSRENMLLHFKKARRHRDPATCKHECDQCGERFFTQSSLEVHLTAAHGAPKGHVCQMCTQTYSSRESLRGHVRRAHRDAHRRARDTHHACALCDKTFTRKYAMNVHMRTHTHIHRARPHPAAAATAALTPAAPSADQMKEDVLSHSHHIELMKAEQ